MLVEALCIRLHAPWVRSLKEKRALVKSLLARLRTTFHVSAAEVDEQDAHHFIVLGIAYIAPHATQADSTAQAIERFIQAHTDAQILTIQRQRL